MAVISTIWLGPNINLDKLLKMSLLDKFLNILLKLDAFFSSVAAVIVVLANSLLVSHSGRRPDKVWIL